MAAPARDAALDDVAVDLRASTPFDRLRAWLGPEPSYRLTRFVVLRLLGFVYFFAFLGLVKQVVPLVGHDGLLPADLFLRRTHFWRFPGLFWLHLSDTFLLTLAYVGTVLSALVALGFANSIVMAILWVLYLSFVHVGQLWYGYGWEILLLETGFLAIFLCAPLDPRPFPRRAPPKQVIWLLRWLTFRIMLGAGLIKMRGDLCWLDFTCLHHHYETQPLPNPLSRYLHFAPGWYHVLGVYVNHMCELVVPFFVFGPRRARHAAGVILVGFQVYLIVSGNLSFLNWLTIVPILACFDDEGLARVLPRRLIAAAGRRAEPPARAHRIAAYCLCGLVALLSIDPVLNLLSPEQRMNGSYEPLSLVNTYGAFGSVGEVRHEIILEGSRDGVTWLPYELPCKPGDPRRRPCITSPYQPRLDWQIWFAAESRPDWEPWVYHLIWKLLHNDRGTLSLLTGNPFPDAPPRWIRAQLYRYELAPPGDPAWWRRTYVGQWLRPLSVDDPELLATLADYGWWPRR